MNPFDIHKSVNSLILEILLNSNFNYIIEKENNTFFKVENFELMIKNRSLKIGNRVSIKNEFAYKDSWFFIYIEKNKTNNNLNINFNFFNFFELNIDYDTIKNKIYFNNDETSVDNIINFINVNYKKHENIFFNNVLINYNEEYFEKIKPIKNKKEFISHLEILKITKY